MIKYFIIGLFFSPVSTVSATSHEAEPQNISKKDPADGSAKQPVLLADPTIYYEAGVYYLYGTHATDKGFEVYTSTDLKNWEKEKELALNKKDVFGDKGFWAPQVFKYKRKYYMAYTASEHIAIANSDSPLGPFKQDIQKSLTDPDGLKNIDPFVFIDNDGKKYLYYVRLTHGNQIFMTELKDDFSDIRPNTITSCVNAVDHPQEWENKGHKTWTVTEGPTVLKLEGSYYLFYSANGFRSIDYAVGYATAKSPSGPWIKYDGNPVLDKDMVDQNGPGHGDFFRDKAGQYYYVFHTHFSNNEVVPRKTAIIRGSFVPGNNGIDRMEFDKKSFYYLKVK